MISWENRHSIKIITDVPNPLMKNFIHNDLEDEICASTIRFEHLQMPTTYQNFISYICDFNYYRNIFSMEVNLGQFESNLFFFFSAESCISLPSLEEDIKLKNLSCPFHKMVGLSHQWPIQRSS